MKHKDYVQLFEDFARAHKDLRHEEISTGYPTGARETFFRSNSDEELIQSMGSQIDSPLLLLKDYSGQLASSNDLSADDLMYGAFMVLKRADSYNFLEIDHARDQCKQIAVEIIAEMQRKMLDEGTCGPIDNFNLNSVRYQFVGPLGDSLYGVMVNFQFTEEAFHINKIDLDTAFRR